MKVEIDLDELILKAATREMDRKYEHECAHIVRALQAQMPEGFDIVKRHRQQVKEYKSLTMWRE